MHVFNPITQEAEAGRSLWVWGQHDLQREFQGSQDYPEKPCLEKPNQNKTKRPDRSNLRKTWLTVSKGHTWSWQQRQSDVTEDVGACGGSLLTWQWTRRQRETSILHDLLSPARSSLLDYPEPTKAVPPTRNRFGKQELVGSMSDTNNKMKRMGSVAFF